MTARTNRTSHLWPVWVIVVGWTAMCGCGADANAPSSQDGGPDAPSRPDASQDAYVEGDGSGSVPHALDPSNPPDRYGDVHWGRATAYGATGGGSCAYPATPNDLMVTAASYVDLDETRMCGACLRVEGPADTITVRVVDRCDGCEPGHLDLSIEAFMSIYEEGEKPLIRWYLVPCDVTGTMTYYWRDDSDPWDAFLQIRNMRYPVATVEVMRDGVWKEFTRPPSYNFFMSPESLGEGPFHLRVTDVFGHVVEDEAVTFEPGVEVPSSLQFPEDPMSGPTPEEVEAPKPEPPPPASCSPDQTCDGQCVELTKDGYNCGACGHRCDPGMRCQGGQCAEAPAPEMVAIPVLDGSTYSIDSTEVTRAQYAAWLDSSPSVLNQERMCWWNASFEPERICIHDDLACQGSECGSHPQVCVDWCDAQAFCRSVGKRVCGRIGGGGLTWSDEGDASRSQWYNACSGAGVYPYAYGDSYADGACNGQCSVWATPCDSGCCTTSPVASHPDCHGVQAPFDGVWDLTGNVLEFEDSCDEQTGPGVDICHVRGGSFFSDEGSLACDQGADANEEVGRSGTHVYVGFRCCAP